MDGKALADLAWPIFEKVCRKKGVSTAEYPEVEPLFWETLLRLYQQQNKIQRMDAYCYRSMQHALVRFLQQRSKKRSMEVGLETCKM